MSLTVTDLFCGAGGSTSGAAQVPGVQIRMAANHWQLAVDTHNTNHPTTDHDCADLSQVDPRRYPKTDLLWASPECTNHSQAKGRKRNTDAMPDLFGDVLPDEAAERSRATMWDVIRFAEHHLYRGIVVENVVDAARWILWPAWRGALGALGYCVHVVYLNSMHAQAKGAPAPQSRDRLYVLAHLEGRCPDLRKWVNPRAWCPTCGEWVHAMQAWKNGQAWGRYGAQYVWRCPRVACRNSVLAPAVLPAAYAIDWTNPGELIRQRSRPLADKTMARITAGLRKYCGPDRAADPVQTYYGGWSMDQAMHTLGDALTRVGMLVPVEGRDGKTADSVRQPVRTLTTRNETAVVSLLVPAGGTWNDEAQQTGDPMRTRTTRDSDAVVIGSPFIAELRGGGSDHRSVADPTATFCASGTHHGLVVPAMVMRNNGSRGEGGEMCTPAGEAMRTLTTAGHQSLVTWPTAAVYTYDTGALRSPGQPLPTQTTVEGDGLLSGQVDLRAEDCYFRMLTTGEIQVAMAFSSGYVVLGNGRERVRQLGNAVTPPAARDLIAALVEAITGIELALAA